MANRCDAAIFELIRDAFTHAVKSSSEGAAPLKAMHLSLTLPADSSPRRDALNTLEITLIPQLHALQSKASEDAQSELMQQYGSDATQLAVKHSNVCQEVLIATEIRKDGTAAFVRARDSWRVTQILSCRLSPSQRLLVPGSIVLVLDATWNEDLLARELRAFCNRLLFPAITVTLAIPNSDTTSVGGRTDLTQEKRLHEAMKHQCESHALVVTDSRFIGGEYDVLIGAGCLDGSSRLSLQLFDSLPVEGYVFKDSVPFNKKPCHGLAELQNLCSQATSDSRACEQGIIPARKSVRVAGEEAGLQQEVGPLIVVVSMVSACKGEITSRTSTGCGHFDESQELENAASSSVDPSAQGDAADAKCPLCAKDFTLWGEGGLRNANTKLHMKYTHQLDWNTQTGELRAFIQPQIRSRGQGTGSTHQASESPQKSAPDRALQKTNLDLGAELGAHVGWFRRCKAMNSKKSLATFPLCLEDLQKEVLTALKQDLASRNLRDWLIPSIAKSIGLCIDLVATDNIQHHAELLAKIDATSTSDALAKIVRNLNTAMSSNKRPAKRRLDDFNGPSEDDSLDSAFTSDPELIRFLSCKDSANHTKLGDFVERSIIRFLQDFLACVARGGLPSILLFASLDEIQASISIESDHIHDSLEIWGTGRQREDDGTLKQAQETSQQGGRRRTVLKLSALDPSLSVEYARLLKIVQMVLTLLRTKKISTMRDIYYMDCRLFESQIKSNRSIEAFARCLNVPRYALNIVSFSRGILCGALRLKEKDGCWVNCHAGPVTMPACPHTMELDASETTAVFVLEKECIFRRLLNDDFIDAQYNGRALLITACGFPDVQTRMLLNRLSHEYPHIPIYGIADFDPYGVEIMATYLFGSKSREHERDVLACPTMRWLGIHSNDLEFYEVPPSLKIEMTERDRGRVKKMLDREAFASPARSFWRQQLQKFLEWDCKYEIEALNAVHYDGCEPLGFLSRTFIHDKICRADYWQDEDEDEDEL